MNFAIDFFVNTFLGNYSDGTSNLIFLPKSQEGEGAENSINLPV